MAKSKILMRHSLDERKKRTFDSPRQYGEHLIARAMYQGMLQIAQGQIAQGDTLLEKLPRHIEGELPYFDERKRVPEMIVTFWGTQCDPNERTASFAECIYRKNTDEDEPRVVTPHWQIWLGKEFPKMVRERIQPFYRFEDPDSNEVESDYDSDYYTKLAPGIRKEGVHALQVVNGRGVVGRTSAVEGSALREMLSGRITG
jgi:hypothetical protein